MIEHVLRTIEKHRLLERGDSVIIALSGGADSVSLLDILNSIKEEYNLKLYAAHLNHCLRGEEADRDEKFCKILCEKYNISLFTKRADIAALAEERGISEELCGRDERYAFFADLAGKLGAKTATAHTASDNAETVLYNLTRGASVFGIRGIPPKNGRVIRPLIEITRSEVEAYCASRGLDYVTDSTNLKALYTRNKIRLGVTPVLRELNPAFESAVMKLCGSASLASDLISRLADEALSDSRAGSGYDSGRLLALHQAVLDEAIARICKEEADFSPEQRHISLIREMLKKGGAVELSKEYTAVVRQGCLRMVKAEAHAERINIPIKKNTKAVFDGKTYSIEYNSDKEICFRVRAAGDSFTLAERGVTKPLRKLMNELKLPAERRDSLALLADGSRVLWCEEIGYSLQGKIYTEKFGLKIEVLKKEGKANA